MLIKFNNLLLSVPIVSITASSDGNQNLSVLKNFVYSSVPESETAVTLEPFVDGEAKLIVSPESNDARFNARIGPLVRVVSADLWKNIPFFSKFLSIPPKIVLKSSTV